MAEIYLAKVSGLQGFEKLVVVKRILPRLAHDHHFIQMFLDEARIAATLQHANIVQMYDIGWVEDDYFISMEYIHGEDLRSIMRRLKKLGRSLPLNHAINIVIGIAAGLHYAHDKVGFDGKPLGIVHRDVNPQNVIVTSDGGVKVVDFGIAKASNRLKTETRRGTLKGKIPYMSPEQCEGKDLDRRSDVYAIGIMLYELTTFTRLYRGDGDFEIMKQIVEQPVIPPSSRKQPYPLQLEQMVMKALHKTLEPSPGAFPSDYRYQTAQELQADLEDFAREEKLVVSSIALSRFMNEIFEDRIDAWRQASDDDEMLAGVIADKIGSGGGDSAGSSGDAASLEDSELADADDPSAVTVAHGRASSMPTARGEVARLATSRRRRRSPLLPGAAVGGLVALLVAGLVWYWPAPAPPRPALMEPARAAASATEAPLSAHEPQVVAPSEEEREAAEKGEAETEDRGADSGSGVSPAVSDRPSHDIWRRAPRSKTPRKAVQHGVKPRNAKPPAAGPPGSLRIMTEPSCEVIVDGRARGSTPIAGIELAAGKHRVQLVNSRFGIDRTYIVEIEAGKVTKRRYTFPLAGD